MLRSKYTELGPAIRICFIVFMLIWCSSTRRRSGIACRVLGFGQLPMDSKAVLVLNRLVDDRDRARPKSGRAGLILTFVCCMCQIYSLQHSNFRKLFHLLLRFVAFSSWRDDCAFQTTGIRIYSQQCIFVHLGHKPTHLNAKRPFIFPPSTNSLGPPRIFLWIYSKSTVSA